MIGDDEPLGEAIFQMRFLVWLTSIGRPRETETPVPFTPRNRGQSSPASDALASNVTIRPNEQRTLARFITIRLREATKDQSAGRFDCERTKSGLSRRGARSLLRCLEGTDLRFVRGQLVENLSHAVPLGGVECL